MLLGWIAGGMMVTDPAVAEHVPPWQPHIKWIAEAAGAVLVLLVGSIAARRVRSRAAARNPAPPAGH